MSKKTLVGFGFGAIQSGLFLYEAFQSGRYDRLVVAEVMPAIVEALRKAKGCYRLNVATADGIDVHEISGVEVLNPGLASDREALVEAVAAADEIATALPSVDFYTTGAPNSVAAVLAAGLRRRFERGDRRRNIVYTAENHNHAAEILAQKLRTDLPNFSVPLQYQVQCLNTVIGKMSGVVADEAQIAEQGLARMAGDRGRCVLVEAFNRILITRIRWPDFMRGITAFEEKDDLLPFEEAKLYGHNATHALLGYLARRRGLAYMADIRRTPELLALGREAFLRESGQALCRKHGGVDPLFTDAGYRAYADDLLERMLNPHLRDAVERVVRDPRRKLGWDDRLVGAMRLALGQGITPTRYAQGAAAALQMLQETESGNAADLLNAIWAPAHPPAAETRIITDLICGANCRA